MSNFDSDSYKLDSICAVSLDIPSSSQPKNKKLWWHKLSSTSNQGEFRLS